VALMRGKVVLPTHFSEIKNEGSVNIFPNPASGYLTVEINEPEMQLKIFNTLGQTMYSGTLREEKNFIDLSAFASGMYFIKQKSYSGAIFHKILIVQ